MMYLFRVFREWNHIQSILTVCDQMLRDDREGQKDGRDDTEKEKDMAAMK